jgi:hypothetical protein
MIGCRDRRTVTDRPPATAADDERECTGRDYASDIAVPEASGAVWLANPGRLLVVSDSGNDGDYVEVDDRGIVVARGRLPLGDAGDDLEGLSLDGDQIWAVSSGGWMRGWRRTASGYQLSTPAYPIDSSSTCAARSVNCGDNFEGLCLSPQPLADGCDGYVAAKTTGALLCLRRDGGQYVIDRSHTYPITDSGKLADCAIADDQTVWTGDNGFALGAVRQWRIAANGATLLGMTRLGLGFPEVLAFGPDHTVYRFSDLGGSPSLSVAFHCPARLPKSGPGASAE